MDTRVEAALQIQREAYAQLWRGSGAMPGWGGAPLPLARGRPVEVRRVWSEVLATVAGEHAGATVMRDGERYVIFIGADPLTPIPGLNGEDMDRFLVWREYARIGLGEVFEDDPAGLLERWSRGGPGERLAAEQRLMERAVPLFLEEAQAIGRHSAAAAVRAWASGLGKMRREGPPPSGLAGPG